MKIYARQVPPEFQISPLFYEECFPENIILTGNRDYKEHTTSEYDLIKSNFDDMAASWEHENFYYKWNGKDYTRISVKSGYTITAALGGYGFNRPDGRSWTTKQLHAWKDLFLSEYGASDEEIFLPALELLTMQTWESKTISGWCQSEWQNMYYPAAEWDRNAVRAFECEYFNMGTEWIVHDGETEPEGPEDVDGYSMYCTSCVAEEIVQQIADETGAPIEDIVLFAYDGEITTTKYKRFG